MKIQKKKEPIKEYTYLFIEAMILKKKQTWKVANN